MRQLLRGSCIAVALTLAGVQAQAVVFINEIHYDNVGVDAAEAIELAGTAGTSLAGWSLVLYNGADGRSYTTTPLAGVFANVQNGFGTIPFLYPTNGIQNGSPDGIALVDASSTVQQFLSYEGVFPALNGPAAGMLSTDIGVAENGTELPGGSLQLVGFGNTYSDFTWTSMQFNTFGGINLKQVFTPVTSPVPEPGTLAMLAGGLLTVASRRRRAR